MADATIKSIAFVAFGSVLVASWVAGNPDRAKLIVSAARETAGIQTTAPAAPAARQPTVTPAAPVQRLGYGVEELRADGVGQYQTDVDFQGVRIRMLVDTGATAVALSLEDARRIGISPAAADYTLPISTANGKAMAARVNIPEIRLGTLLVSDVPAIVLPQEVKGVSLLGMTFLKKLSSFQIAENKLTMRQ